MSEIDSQIYNTNVHIHYKRFPHINKQFASSFYPYFTNKWNSSHKTLKNKRDINEYKIKLKIYITPVSINFIIMAQQKFDAVTSHNYELAVSDEHEYLNIRMFE